MLSREEYNNLRTISDKADENRFISESDLGNAIAAGNRLVDIFHNGFNLYLEEREEYLIDHNERIDEVNDIIIFYDKEADFDSWFNIVHTHYFPALLDLKVSDLNDYDTDILMTMGRFTMFCERLVPHIGICVSFC